MNLRTLGATKVLGAVGLLVIIAMGWMLVVGPKTAQFSEVRLGIESTRAQNGVLQAQLAALQKQAGELAEVRATARGLAERFPPTADQPAVFSEVTGAAVAAGIGPRDLTSLAPTPPLVGGTDPATGVPLEADDSTLDLARQTVTVMVEGSYDQTQRLLENLEKMPRAFLITSVALTGGSPSGGFTTTITGDMFVMPPVDDPGAALDSLTADADEAS